METFIALLRGINVGGNRKVKMDALRDLFKNIGAINVKTYIQSGNVVFSYAKTDCFQLANIIERQIELTFGFTVPVIIKTKKQLYQIIDDNPFSEQIINLHVTLLSEVVDNSINIEPLLLDEFKIVGDVIYLVCPTGYGNSKLNNTFFEKKLKVKATTRNWKTMNELLKLTDL